MMSYGFSYFSNMKFLLLGSILVLIMFGLETAESRDIAKEARDLADAEEDGFNDSEMELENAAEIPKKSPYFWVRRRRKWQQYKRYARYARYALTAWRAFGDDRAP